MKVDPKTIAGRAFVRSLNILLKFARLYGYEHARTKEQLQTAWTELHAAIPIGTESGLLLGATGSQLLLDGVPLEGSPAEKQFAQLLSAAGLASVQFLASVTEEEIAVAKVDLAKDQVCAEAGPDKYQLPPLATGRVAEGQAWQYPTLWRAWQEGETWRRQSAVEVRPVRVGRVAASRARRRFTRF